VKRYGYEVAVAVAVGEELPESEKNAVAMGIRPPLSKALSVFFLVFYIFLLFLLFCRPNGYTAGPSWAVNQITI
jgi:hypothetical protein